jgi:hypothetical protein
MLIVLELTLPLILLALLAFQPAQQRAIRLLQIFGTGLILLAAQLAGLWIMPPWWTPWLLWPLFALAIWRQRTALRRTVATASDYAIALFWIVILCIGGWIAIDVLRAQTPPPGEIVEISLPMLPGRHYVAGGGSREIVNAHLRTLPRATKGQRHYWGQSYAVDLIATDRWGLVTSAAIPVLAPCSGYVVRTHDGVADGSPVDLSSPTARAGNFAMIRCDRFDILLAHFRNGSLRVATGAFVHQGTEIAALGNSGASNTPHLHIHAQKPGTADAPFSGQPVPIMIAGRYLVRGDRP